MAGETGDREWCCKETVNDGEEIFVDAEHNWVLAMGLSLESKSPL